MKKNYAPGGIDVLILCGGMGRRLKSIVTDVPKPMADIGGRPFLDILIDYVAGYGFRRFILCTGYKGEVIKRYYSKREFPELLTSHEKRPLGTAGAVKNAEGMVESDPFMVVNGDSFCRLDLRKFASFYKNKKAVYAMALLESEKAEDFGLVGMDGSRRIISFNEKVKTGGGFINCGVYLLDKKIFSVIERGRKLSLEYDVFPKITSERFYGYAAASKLVDIGTPDRYAEAAGYLNNVI